MNLSSSRPRQVSHAGENNRINLIVSTLIFYSGEYDKLTSHLHTVADNHVQHSKGNGKHTFWGTDMGVNGTFGRFGSRNEGRRRPVCCYVVLEGKVWSTWCPNVPAAVYNIHWCRCCRVQELLMYRLMTKWCTFCEVRDQLMFILWDVRVCICIVYLMRNMTQLYDFCEANGWRMNIVWTAFK